jgi:hypothetical protein
MHDVNYVDLILAFFFLYPILLGYVRKFSSVDLKRDVYSLESGISLIISILTSIFAAKITLIQYGDIINSKVNDILSYININLLNGLAQNGVLPGRTNNNQYLIYIVLIVLFTLIISRILKLIFIFANNIAIFQVFDEIELFLNNKSNFLKRIIGAVIQVPKAICYCLIISIILNITSMFSLNHNFNNYLEASKPYKFISENVIAPVTNSKLAKELPKVLNDSMKVVIKPVKPGTGNNIPETEYNPANTLVYYNGVTLDEGVKSNIEINEFAKNIVYGHSAVKEKANILYNWVGKNINYDYNKADKVLNNNFDIKSGAITTFKTKKGICFDYSCLYAAMCRAVGIKVRLITGKGFNGTSWVSHAWNQIYLLDEERWANVDCTFYNYADYFDNNSFDLDHTDAQIAGEW